MNKIKWSPYRSDNPEAPICGTYKGKFVDIRKDDFGGWFVIWNGRVLRHGHPDKQTAVAWIEDAVSKFKE